MTLENPTFRSPLDKPLGKLTEDDISQLTREDCRRYLKDKGMRRPSWNKAQAIEQVISLKTLLEGRTDSDIFVRIKRKINPSRVDLVSAEESSSDLQISEVAKKSDSNWRKSALQLDHLPLPNNKNTSPTPSELGATNGLMGQMTIFYRGKVNVYDAMPADKAQVIMQLAASPISLPRDPTSSRISLVRPFLSKLQEASINEKFASPSVAAYSAKQNLIAEQYKDEGIQSREVEQESLTCRKASLQRYLKKRKDRGRFKNKVKMGISSSSSLEMYLNHQAKSLNLSEQSSPSGTCSPPQPRSR
ncbi:hypothetical protein GIB67_027075 [Kingdonia uniflora]|uniref:Protein TIFY n=1 Tax=Kingdonia uniflora TaxID=39325 RepID=A0A7J7P222_9MAGN|nr:hypothetical protein GIB67_027075 [Kingdonia uniflora]